MRRPISLSILSWGFIVYGAIAAAALIFLLSSVETRAVLFTMAAARTSASLAALPVELHIAFGLVSSVVLIVTGFFMLRGRNWARSLSLFWWTTGLVLVAIEYGLSLTTGSNLLTYLVVVYVLTSKKVVAHFDNATT